MLTHARVALRSVVLVIGSRLMHSSSAAGHHTLRPRLS